MDTCLNVGHTFSLCKVPCVALRFAPEERQFVSSKTPQYRLVSYCLREESATSKIDLAFEKCGVGEEKIVIA
jgi:hypothetical protein